MQKEFSIKFSLSTYISIKLLKSFHVVEIMHDFLLVPAFNVGHEVDPAREITIVVILSRLLVLFVDFDVLLLVHGALVLNIALAECLHIIRFSVLCLIWNGSK